MNVLLLSMPDSFEHMPPVAIRMPNGALTSLAGNVDPQHRVAVADLILAQRQVRETVTRLVREFDPEVVGLSIMTFQRRTAVRIVELVRALRPGVKIVVGGYDPSLAPEAYEEVTSTILSAAREKSRSANCCAQSSKGPASTGSAVSPTEGARTGCTTPTGRRTALKTAKSVRRTAMRVC